MHIGDRDPSKPEPNASGRHAAALRVIAACLACVLTTGAALAQQLNGEVQRLIRESPIADAQVSIAAVDLETGALLLAIDADRQRIPASNMKLLTTGAALIALGPDHTFETTFHVEGDRLILTGSGDPALGDPDLLEAASPDLTIEALLATLTERLAADAETGIRQIVLDDRVFDRQRQHPTWDPDDVNKSWQPEVAGINFHGNTLAVFAAASPDGPGARPDVKIQPQTDAIRIDVQGRSVTRSRTTAWVARARHANLFTLFGNVRGPALAPIRVPVYDPATFFGALLAERLAGPQGVPGVRAAEATDRFELAQPSAVIKTPLIDIVNRCNVVSQNLYAEALLKAVGHAITGEPGSFSNGGASLRMILAERLGPDAAAATVVADGSGLSRDNRLTAATMVRWLTHFHEDDELGPVLRDSLPTRGVGTLRRWFRDEPLQTELRAKTGYLTGVRGLSGYLIHPETGRAVAFSILINGVGAGSGNAESRTLTQRIVRQLDAYLADAGALAGEPSPAGADLGG